MTPEGRILGALRRRRTEYLKHAFYLQEQAQFGTYEERAFAKHRASLWFKAYAQAVLKIVQAKRAMNI